MLLFLLLCSAFFSSAETAIFSLNPIQVHRLRKTHPGTGLSLEKLLANPTELLSTRLIGNTVVNVAAAVLGFAIAERLWPSYGKAISIPVMTFALLIVGEFTPKRLALSRPEALATAYAPALRVLVGLMTPLRVVLGGATTLFQKYLRRDKRSLTEEEFRTVVEVGEEEGALDEEERTMIDGIIRLEETQASDVMTPRVDLVGIDLDDSLDESKRTARSARFRYLPVYRGSLDEPEGFLDVPRFLLSPKHDLAAATIASFFVPETAPLDTLLATFQREQKRVAYVTDEFGGTAGLITRGDILEEIVTDVDNEFGEAELTIEKTGESLWLINGSVSLEDVNYELDTHLEAEGADRVAGWVTALAERIPRTGDVVEAQGCRATVRRTRRNRITVVLLEKLSKEVEQEEGDE